jgi:hypothetical protein
MKHHTQSSYVQLLVEARCSWHSILSQGLGGTSEKKFSVWKPWQWRDKGKSFKGEEPGKGLKILSAHISVQTLSNICTEKSQSS